MTVRRTLLVAALLLAGCATGDAQPRGAASGAPAAGSSATPSPAASVAPIVGTWRRLQRCDELQQVMDAAGLHDALLEFVATDGWIPGVTRVDQIADPERPCRGAVDREHSHFFTADGQFGSLDAQGDQVDDGPYELVGDDVVVIGAVRFRYEITGGDTIAFTPEVPRCSPGCWEAGWSLAVANPGHTWRRVG